MSCNGCRVLRKGCSDSCILGSCLEWIDTAEGQANATLFVAKFFGRAALMSLISAVPDSSRPALFRSLLYEACGRTVNPIYGAVGLLRTGDWHVCQTAVETVLRGDTLPPPADISRPPAPGGFDDAVELQRCDLELSLTSTPILSKRTGEPTSTLRPPTPSMESEGSVTTCSGGLPANGVNRKLLNLFV